MFGFLLKVIIFAALVGGIGYAYVNRAKYPQLAKLNALSSQLNLAQLKTINSSNLGTRLSETLDSLVTHPDKNSPVVLGVQITNESLGKIVDVIRTLPPDQVSELKQVICSPATSSSNGR